MRSAPPMPPGMPRMKDKPAMPASCASACDFHIRHRGAGADAISVLHLDLVETAAKPDHHARHAAVTHNQVGAEPDDDDGDVGQRFQK
jgi:hypothetical protein